MTLDSLRTMLDPEAMLAREQDERARNRCPVREWSGGRVALGEPTTNQFGRPVVPVTVTGAKIVSSRTPIDGGQFTFNVPLPAKEMQSDSEIGQMMLSLRAIGVPNILALDGATNTAAIEREHEYTGREWVADPNGKSEWRGESNSSHTKGEKGDFQDITKRLTYYQFTVATIGGKAASNGSMPTGSGCDPAALAIANEYSLTHTDDEIAAGGKLAQALQQAGVVFANGQNGPLQTACVTGKLREFLAQHYAEIPAPAGVGGSN